MSMLQERDSLMSMITRQERKDSLMNMRTKAPMTSTMV